MFDLCTREAVPKPTEINGIYRDAEENPLGTGIYLMTALSSPKLRLGSVSLEDSRVLLPHVLPAATGAAGNTEFLKHHPNPELALGEFMLCPFGSTIVWTQVPVSVLLRGFEHQIQNV